MPDFVSYDTKFQNGIAVDFKLRSLEAFCAAVEEGSISGAARKLYVTQPGLSDKISELERELRVPLLKRSQRGVVLTPQGRAIHEHAKRVLDGVSELKRTAYLEQHAKASELHLASCLTIGEYLVPKWLQEFKKEMPEMVPQLFMGNNQEVIRAVENEEMTLGIIGSNGRSRILKRVPLLDDELVIVVAHGHPWSQRRVSLKDLATEPFIAREQSSTTRETIEHALKGMDVSLNIQMELGSMTAIKEAVESNLGISILAKSIVKEEVHSKRLAIAGGFSMPLKFVVVHSPTTFFTHAEQHFRKYLVHQRRNLDKSVPEDSSQLA